MAQIKENHFVFKGEIAELFTLKSSAKARIMCKPGILMFEVPLLTDYQLGDKVLITGNFICEKIEIINHINTNH